MIIEFTGTPEALAEADANKVNHAVNEILTAHRKGHHFGIIPRSTSSWLLKNLHLGERESATLARLAAEYSTTASLLSGADHYLSIQVGHRAGAAVNGRAIVVGLDDVQGNFFFDRAALVVEDQEVDGKLYLAIADACRAKVGAQNVALDVRHGGGERSKNVLLHLAEEQRICVLLTDSDSRLPGMGTPAKVLRYQREIYATGWKLAWVQYTPCREIENLIPLDVVRLLPAGVSRADHIEALGAISHYETTAGLPLNESFWWYYDLKNGIDSVQLERVWPDPLREWTKSKMDLAASAYSGISETLVQQLLDHKTQLPVFLRLVKESPWWDLFGHVIKTLIWLGFAPMVQRT